jgi:hypothetical protein
MQTHLGQSQDGDGRPGTDTQADAETDAQADRGPKGNPEAHSEADAKADRSADGCPVARAGRRGVRVAIRDTLADPGRGRPIEPRFR